MDLSALTIPAAPGSSPKQNIYAFLNLCLNCDFKMTKKPKEASIGHLINVIEDYDFQSGVTLFS